MGLYGGGCMGHSPFFVRVLPRGDPCIERKSSSATFVGEWKSKWFIPTSTSQLD
jgi:hypothetical protein